MKSFKQYLTEAVKLNFAPWHEKDPKTVWDLIYHMGDNYRRMCKVLANGTVRITKDYELLIWPPYKKDNFDPEKLPIYFSSAYGEVTISSKTLKSVWGAPAKCKYLRFENCAVLETLEHLESDVDKLIINCENLTSFKCNVKANHVIVKNMKSFDVEDFVSSFDSQNVHLFISKNVMAEGFYKKPLLKLLRANHLKELQSTFPINNEFNVEKFQEVMQAFVIINKYLTTSRDIWACQEELMDNDLHDYADF